MRTPEVPLACHSIPYSPELWDKLAPTWREVSSRCRNVSAFLSPDWIGIWLRHFGPALQPSASIWSEPDGSPVACILYSQPRARLGPFGITRLFVNATGEGVVETEHNDILALPEYRDRVLREFVGLALASASDELALAGFNDATALQIAECLNGARPSLKFQTSS